MSAEEAAPRSLAGRALSGAVWTTATGLAARLLSLVGTVLLVRFVAPGEYGEAANASVLVMTASQLATLGVGTYVVANPRAGRAVVFHATFIHVVLGAIALAVVWAGRHRLGAFIDAPALGRFIPGLAVALLVDRVTFMAERPVVRDLGFRRISVSRTLGEVSYTAVSVLAAWRGAGGMAIVYGNLARSGVRFGVLLLLSSWREWATPVPLAAHTLRTLASYGSIVALNDGAGFASRRWDNLLVSRLFGPAVAGQYILAYNLADLPSVQVGEQITDVLFASFAHVPEERRAAALVRTATLLTLLMAPLSIGLGAVGPSIVAAFFPPAWAALGPLLFALAAVLTVRPIGSAFGVYVQIRRGPLPCAVGEIVGLLTMLVLVYTVGRLGPLWVCMMVGVAFAARALVFLWYVQRTDGLRISACVAPLAPIFVACAPMIAAVLAVRHGLVALGLHRPVLSLALEISVGALAYAVAVFALARPAVVDFLGLVRKTLRRRRLNA
jgi:lipopolysaccharide exporter